jgi:hypothetical protein
MDIVNEDAELASEMVVLLGRELKATRRRITELETQLAEKVWTPSFPLSILG